MADLTFLFQNILGKCALRALFLGSALRAFPGALRARSRCKMRFAISAGYCITSVEVEPNVYSIHTTINIYIHNILLAIIHIFEAHTSLSHSSHYKSNSRLQRYQVKNFHAFQSFKIKPVVGSLDQSRVTATYSKTINDACVTSGDKN